MIKLFVGLGNPGTEYEDTRHNAGFWWIDQLAQQLKVQLQPDKNHHGWVARTTLQGDTLWLLKPATFMNLSGKAVASLARFYKIEPAHIMVVHDELDVVPGEAKLKLGGSHAGHNGLRDIIAAADSNEFVRVRVGIGRPPGRMDAADFVLKNFSGDERKELPLLLALSADAVEEIVTKGALEAMNAVNAR